MSLVEPVKSCDAGSGMRVSAMAEQITPLLITYNEAPNLKRILAKLSWAKRIVVIDSGSTDETLDILRACQQVRVVFHPFTDFASQCNFGLAQVNTPWVLSLDADYELSDELMSEIQSLVPGERAGFRARFVYRIYGRSLRGSLYPPRIVLYRKSQAIYQNEGHGHRVSIDGEIAELAYFTMTVSRCLDGSRLNCVMRTTKLNICSRRLGPACRRSTSFG
jgi:glycosyltransferase involved in cell wall biosynthesis